MTATLAGAISSPPHLEESVAVRFEVRGGTLFAKPAGRGASALSAFMRADGVIRVPVGTTGLNTGDEVLVDPLPGAPTGPV